MARAIHVRLDDASDAALTILRADGASDSAAVRLALYESAARRRRRSAIVEEVRSLASDPGDVAEMARIRQQMDELALPFPE